MSFHTTVYISNIKQVHFFLSNNMLDDAFYILHSYAVYLGINTSKIKVEYYTANMSRKKELFYQLYDLVHLQLKKIMSQQTVVDLKSEDFDVNTLLKS